MPTRRPASWAVVLITVAVLAACDAGPVVTGPPAVGNPTPAPSSGSPGPSEEPFSRASWPASGSACGTEGYTGNLGRIEATEARTVVFTLCAPDGAFLSRVAHPALGILDAATIAGLATNPGSARSLAAPAPTGSTTGRPGRTSGSSGPATRPRPTPRSRRSSSPGPTTRPSARSACSRRPSTGSTPRGRPTSTGSRRCPSSPSSRATGSPPPTWGSGPAPAWARSPSGAPSPARSIATRWRATGSPPARSPPPTSRRARSTAAAAARIGTASTPRRRARRSRRPSSTWGRRTCSTSPTGRCPACPIRRGSPRPSPRSSRPTSGCTPRSTRCPSRDLPGRSRDRQARRAVPRRGRLEPRGPGRLPRAAVRRGRALDRRRPDAEGRARHRGCGRHGGLRRARRRVRPRQRRHPGRRGPRPAGPPGLRRRVPCRRGGRGHLAARPRPLGGFTPGDRSQLVFMQSSEPDGAYCGDQVTLDAYRLCGLVVEGLYGFKPGTMTVEPRLAQVRAQRPGDGLDVPPAPGRDVPGRRPPRCRRRAHVVRRAVGPIAAAAPGVPAPFANWDALFGGTIGN